MTDSPPAVLVVDDDFDLRETLSELLEDNGYPTACVSDGLEALEYLKTHPAPRLILLDWMMPRCSGEELCAKLGDDPALRKIPVAVLSADVDIGRKVAFDQVVTILQKPISIRSVLEMLERI
jgi:CheY-like chemotaxis protein